MLILEPLRQKYPFNPPTGNEARVSFWAAGWNRVKMGQLFAAKRNTLARFKLFLFPKREENRETINCHRVNCKSFVGSLGQPTGSLVALVPISVHGHPCFSSARARLQLLTSSRRISWWLAFATRSTTRLKIKSIPLDQAVVAVTSDASWANCSDLHSQAAYMVMISHQDVSNDKWADVSPLRWKSWKLDRRTQSTLGAELMALSRALAEGDWIRSLACGGETA